MGKQVGKLWENWVGNDWKIGWKKIGKQAGKGFKNRVGNDGKQGGK